MKSSLPCDCPPPLPHAFIVLVKEIYNLQTICHLRKSIQIQLNTIYNDFNVDLPLKVVKNKNVLIFNILNYLFTCIKTHYKIYACQWENGVYFEHIQ